VIGANHEFTPVPFCSMCHHLPYVGEDSTSSVVMASEATHSTYTSRAPQLLPVPACTPDSRPQISALPRKVRKKWRCSTSARRTPRARSCSSSPRNSCLRSTLTADPKVYIRMHLLFYFVFSFPL
jgi:hypothetical protein